MLFFCLFFKAFLAFFWPFFWPFFVWLVRNVRDVGWVPLHILTCATFDADGAPEKSVGDPPPPAHQLFWDLRYHWGGGGGAGGGRGKCVCPPTIRFGFAPLTNMLVRISPSRDYPYISGTGNRATWL